MQLRSSNSLSRDVHTLLIDKRRISIAAIAATILIAGEGSAADTTPADKTSACIPVEIDLDSSVPQSMIAQIVRIDGRVTAITPAHICIPAGAHELSLAANEEFTFNYAVTVTAAALPTVQDKDPGHCGPERERLKPALDGKVAHLTASFFKAGPWECGASAATGAPDGRVKLRFTTSPEGGSLSFPASERFERVSGPKTLTLPFVVGAELYVFCQKQGYFDGVTRLQFFVKDGARWVHPNEGSDFQVSAAEPNKQDVPSVTCSLQKQP